jgi:hypothetical protein
LISDITDIETSESAAIVADIALKHPLHGDSMGRMACSLTYSRKMPEKAHECWNFKESSGAIRNEIRP